jgi:hypothetical protein
MSIYFRGVLIQTMWNRDWWKVERSSVWSGEYIQSYLNFFKLGPLQFEWLSQ